MKIIPQPASILLVENSLFYSKTLINFLNSIDIQPDLAKDFKSALALLQTRKYKIGIISISPENDRNGFDLVHPFKTANPYSELILMTNDIVDNYIDKIIELDISYFLSLPIKKDEFQALIKRILHKKERGKIFGLKNCMTGLKKIFTLEINKSEMIPHAINTIFEAAREENFEFNDEFIANLVINEMLVNAIYHSHGFINEKLKRIPVKLPAGKKVEINFGRDNTRFGISVVDFMGTLSKIKIYESIKSIVEQNKFLEKSDITENEIFDKVKIHGRGIELIRKFSGEYSYIIEKGKRTEGIIIFDSMFEKDAKYASIKIMEF